MPKTRHNLKNARSIDQSSTVNPCIALVRLLPPDHKSLVFTAMALAHLVVGIIHFSQTGDASMVSASLYVGAGYVGISEGMKKLPTFISRFKDNEK